MGLLEEIQKRRKEGELKKKETASVEKKPSYSTSVDQLYRLTESDGHVSFKDASKSLGIGEDTVEEWANVLSQQELVSIHYPAFGSPEIRKIGYEKKTVKSTKPMIKTVFTSKKKVAVGTLVFLVVILIIFAVPHFQKGVVATPIQQKAEIAEVKAPVSVAEAFSGEGKYKCIFSKGGVDATYYMKDKNMRIETMYSGVASVVLYYKDFIYTYFPNDDKWYKTKPSPDALVPGSDNLPSEDVSIECYSMDVLDDDLFKIDPAKVIL